MANWEFKKIRLQTAAVVASKSFNKNAKISEHKSIHHIVHCQPMATIGIKGKDSVALFSYKGPLDNFTNKSDLTFMRKVSKYIGMSATGLAGDCHATLQAALLAAYIFKRKEGMEAPADIVLEELKQACARRSLNMNIRTFSNELLVASYNDDADEFKLQMIDGVGKLEEHAAYAVGYKCKCMNKILGKIGTRSRNILAAGCKALKEALDNELTAENVDIGVVTKKGFKILSPNKVECLLETY